MALVSHISNAASKVPAQPLELQPGFVAYIQYENRKSEVKYSMYLILDVNPKMSRTIHCLDLAEVTQQQFYRLFDFAEGQAPAVMEFKNRPSSRIIWEKPPTQNYDINIKPRLKQMKGAYKMLKFEGIKRISVVDYKWKKTLIEKYARD